MEFYQALNKYTQKSKELFKQYSDNKESYVSALQDYQHELGLSTWTTKDTEEGIIFEAYYKGQKVKQLLGLDDNYQLYFIKDLT